MGNERESINDPLDNLEENYAGIRESEGYNAGFEVGKRDGQTEGYSLGFDEGARRGAEVGYFKGYTMTFKHLVARDDVQHQRPPSKARTLKKMDDLLELIDNFPHTNETNSDEKLSILRAKFKQTFASATNTPKTTNNWSLFCDYESIIIDASRYTRFKLC